jgi:malate dehydrogenase (quinone)
LKQCDDKSENKITDLATGKKRKVYTKFVFIGAGGGSATLEKSRCPKEMVLWFSCKWTMV